MNKIATSIFGTLALIGSSTVVSATGINKPVFPVEEKKITATVDSKEKASLDNLCEEFWDYAEHNPAAVGTIAALGLGALGLGAVRIKNRNNKFGKPFVRYEYTPGGQIIHRLNFNEAGIVESVTRYKNGEEDETVQLYTNVNDYNYPNKNFDIIIDPIEQNKTGDCWLLNGLSLLGEKPWGREVLKDAISIDNKTGNITIRFKKAYGKTKKFVITPQELSEAMKERKGNGYKYASGDTTVVAIELAVEKSRNEAGFGLDTGGYLDEIIALFTDINNVTTYINKSITLEDCSELLSDKEIEESELHDKAVEHLLSNMKITYKEYSDTLMKKKLQKFINNPNYICEIGLKMDSGELHAAQVLRFEKINGKDYIIYTHPWNQKAEIVEELNEFVKNKLYDMTVSEKFNPNSINTSMDSSSFKMCNKSNKTNLAAAIYSLKQNPDFKPDIIKDGNRYFVKIDDTKIKITCNELETAILSGRYSTGNPSVTLLEIAIERYINRKKHNNNVFQLENTNIETVDIKNILDLLTNKNSEKYESSNLKKAYKKEGLKFAVAKRYGAKTYYVVKEIKQLPNNKYTISVVQPEDTSIVVTYTEDEFKRLFSGIEIYS